MRRKLRRGQVVGFFRELEPCLVAMETCGGAHYFARELRGCGHDVRLIPPQYMKPFVKTHKNDAADAEAICEAAQRPTMRFAPIKSQDQQAVLMIHRTRDLLIRQRTQLINALRGHLSEFGIVVAQGRCNTGKLTTIVEDETDDRLPNLARQTLRSFVEQLHETNLRIVDLERRLKS